MKGELLLFTEPKQDLRDFMAQISGEAPWTSGQVIGFARGGKMLAIALYTRFEPRGKEYQSCELHLASTSPLWCAPDILYHIFSYPFVQLGCERITGLIYESNLRARKCAEHLGFVEEGRSARVRPNDNLVIYRMFKEDCRWLNYEQNAILRTAA